MKRTNLSPVLYRVRGIDQVTGLCRFSAIYSLKHHAFKRAQRLVRQGYLAEVESGRVQFRMVLRGSKSHATQN
jgi:hypothetical protein